MPNLTNLMLNAHHMNLVHQYLSVRDIIVFYSSSNNMLKVSHQPLQEGLLSYEYPFLDYNLIHYLNKLSYNIYVYAILKARKFDDIVAYLGTISDSKHRENIALYPYYISECFENYDEKNVVADYMIISSYDKFFKPYIYVQKYNKLFDLDDYDSSYDKLYYSVNIEKSLHIFAGKLIRWEYPSTLIYMDKKKTHLIKPFSSCKITSKNYLHKSSCKSHQICEMLNWQKFK